MGMPSIGNLKNLFENRILFAITKLSENVNNIKISFRIKNRIKNFFSITAKKKKIMIASCCYAVFSFLYHQVIIFDSDAIINRNAIPVFIRKKI